VLTHAPVLEDGGTWVRRWRPEDAPRLRCLYDSEVLRWDLAPQQRSVEALRRRITVLAELELALGKRLRLAICRPKADQVAGAVDLIADQSRHGRSVEVAFLLGPDARGGGIASAAVRLVADWALAEAGFDQVFLRAHPDNGASQGVARRAGFQQLAMAECADGRSGQRVTFVRERAPG
jgi:RimJ/RimL family protein N-acetyltransferase